MNSELLEAVRCNMPRKSLETVSHWCAEMFSRPRNTPPEKAVMLMGHVVHHLYPTPPNEAETARSGPEARLVT